MNYAQKYTPAVKKYLLDGVDLTHKTLIENGQGWRLSSVIHVLRKRGWQIETHLDMRRIGHYRLSKGWTPDMLKIDAPSTGKEKGAGNAEQ